MMKIHTIMVTLFMVFLVVGCTSQPAADDNMDAGANENNEQEAAAPAESATDQDVNEVISELDSIAMDDEELDISDLDNLEEDLALFE
jgi:PBP1b-binding outer membrane lipoprotein LpoB